LSIQTLSSNIHPKTSFAVHLADQDIEIIWKGKLYVADFSQYYNVHATCIVTKVEKALAKRAYKLLHNASRPSVQGAIHLIEAGNISNLPALVTAHFHRAIELFGPQ